MHSNGTATPWLSIFICDNLLELRQNITVMRNSLRLGNLLVNKYVNRSLQICIQMGPQPLGWRFSKPKSNFGILQIGYCSACNRSRGMHLWRSEERRVGKECRSRWSL